MISQRVHAVCVVLVCTCVYHVIPVTSVNVTRLQDAMVTLARQTMMQQLQMEERVRTSGHSGVKQVRFRKDGSRAYHTASHIGAATCAIHDHADHFKTVGIGEFVAVMNGVDFRTRHNDYMLYMPSRTSSGYKAVEEIEFPPVPLEVFSQATVELQIAEMREWFKAWAEQDTSRRPYKQYFKPVLCYMEGAWTETDFGSIDEPFQSDRHHVSASNWYDLQEKIRYTAYTGGKDKGENYAFLPTKIVDINEETKEPVYAQWNYRILCHPVKSDIPLQYLQPVDDLHARMATKSTMEQFAKSKDARFVLSHTNAKRQYKWDILEDLMKEIPGMDNYPVHIADKSFGNQYSDPTVPGQKLLNAGYYHSWYGFTEKDAMGLSTSHRTFSDRQLYVAFNTRPEVAPRTVLYCDSPRKNESCYRNYARVSYAVPLEIVWLTPLHSWNPYNIELKTSDKTKATKKTRRTGGFTASTAFDGNDGWHFYRTPHDFFSGSEVERDEADTALSKVGVLDRNGVIRNVTASGVRIFLPQIPGIEGNLRTRYPIFPVHEEGSTAYKNVEALQDIVMKMKEDIDKLRKGKSYDVYMTPDQPTAPELLNLRTSLSTTNPPGSHYHTVTVQGKDLARLMKGKMVSVTTSVQLGHSHNLRIKLESSANQVIITRCDNNPVCWDGHSNYLTEMD